MSKTSVKIEYISKGFEEILCSSDAGNVCKQQAERIKENANAELKSGDTVGFKSGGRIVKAYGSKRWMYFVHTTDAATMLAEQNDNTLIKAVK